MAEIPFEPYTGQSKLRFWCQKVLPLVYDDSLSYYELLNKVVDYLNNTITDVSACEDNITALRDAFVQLQDYVNEQLEDFAPEVERIIDEMIDSGEFGDILADTVNGLIANDYSTTQGYAQFDYVLKDGKLYCAIVSTSGEWDASKWRETTVGTDMQLLSQRLYNLNAGQVAYNEAETYDNNTVGKKLKDLDDFDDNLNAGQVAFNEGATYDNDTVGKKLKDLDDFDDNLNAGQVAFNEGTTYDNDTVGKKLKDLDDFDDNLNAGQVAYNSEGAYNNATVGKELQELKGSLNRLTKNVIVDINGNGDYTSILRALKETESYVTVYVLPGTYNIWQEYIDYYGPDFWTNYSGYNYSTDQFTRGLWLGDGRKVIGVGNPSLYCHNTAALTPVAQYFSVFANGNNTELDGFEIHFSSLRYAIHDDFGLINSRTIWKNLIFYGSSGSIFGGGMGYNSSYLIENCSFYSNNGTYDINYHASTSNYTDNRCHIIVKDCRGNHICKFGYYGASMTKSVCIVINSSFLRVENGMHGTGQPNNNIELYQWVIPPRFYRDNRSTTSYFVPMVRTNTGAWSTFLIWGCVSPNTGEFLYMGNATGGGVNLLPIHVSDNFGRTLTATMADNGMTINSSLSLTGGFSLVWIDTAFGVQPDGNYTVTQ